MYNEQMIQELRKRWNALQQALAREGGDAILITTNVNLFYVSGRIFSGRPMCVSRAIRFFSSAARSG